MGEVLEFPNNNERGERVGFYELADVEVGINNVLSQTANPDRVQNQNPVIKEISGEMQEIGALVEEKIDGIDGLRPGMPSVEEFREAARSLVMTPFDFGSGRPAIDYFPCNAIVHHLTKKYEAKLASFKQEGFASLR